MARRGRLNTSMKAGINELIERQKSLSSERKITSPVNFRDRRDTFGETSPKRHGTEVLAKRKDTQSSKYAYNGVMELGTNRHWAIDSVRRMTNKDTSNKAEVAPKSPRKIASEVSERTAKQ